MFTELEIAVHRIVGLWETKNNIGKATFPSDMTCMPLKDQ